MGCKYEEQFPEYDPKRSKHSHLISFSHRKLILEWKIMLTDWGHSLTSSPNKAI